MVRLAEHIAQAGGARNGTLVMLPTKALVKEWNLPLSPALTLPLPYPYP